jgi:2,5-furandicarboxylate decarboxylase 1
MQPDLRTFLKTLKKDHPDQLLTITAETAVEYSSTAVALELEKQGRYPALLFERLAGSEVRMAANLFASRAVIAAGLGIQAAQFSKHFGRCLDNLVPSRKVESGPVHEQVFEGDQINLGNLPVPLHFLDDAGPYITAGMIASRDPDSGVGNLAYARLQIKGPRRMGVSLHSRQHLWDHHRRAAQAGKDLPVAVVIGAHPAVMLAAAAKMGIGEDEYDLAGALLGQPLEVCQARTVDVDVPAHAEIVIEGHILANTEETEGPFGEYTGYTTGRSTNNVLEVTAITMRSDAIFVDIVPGNSSDHLTLGRAAKEAWVHKLMQEALPFYQELYYPSSGTHFHCYIQIDKSAEGQAKQAAQLVMGLDHYIKLAVIVDKDIDPSDEAAVLWAMATRMQADSDVDILSNLMCNRLDPSSHDGVGAKMIIDATELLNATARRVVLPEEAERLAKDMLSKE